MTYSDALKAALVESESIGRIVVYRVSPASLTDSNAFDELETSYDSHRWAAVQNAVMLSFQLASPLVVEMQIGGEGAPWVAVHRVNVDVSAAA